MIITIPGVEDLIASINEQLPPAIRVWGYVSYHDIYPFLESGLFNLYQGRVQKSFNARLLVDIKHLYVTERLEAHFRFFFLFFLCSFLGTVKAGSILTSSRHIY